MLSLWGFACHNSSQSVTLRVKRLVKTTGGGGDWPLFTFGLGLEDTAKNTWECLIMENGSGIWCALGNTGGNKKCGGDATGLNPEHPLPIMNAHPSGSPLQRHLCGDAWSESDPKFGTETG